MSEIEQEIEALEREAEDPVTSVDTRRFNRLRATLLRHSYRLQSQPDDSRILLVIHMPSQTLIDRVTVNEVRMARMWSQGWIQRFDEIRRRTVG